LFFRTASFFLPEVHYKSYLTWFGVFDRMVGAGIADKIDKKKTYLTLACLIGLHNAADKIDLQLVATCV
jgi:hypothetical protein